MPVPTERLVMKTGSVHHKLPIFQWGSSEKTQRRVGGRYFSVISPYLPHRTNAETF